MSRYRVSTNSIYGYWFQACQWRIAVEAWVSFICTQLWLWLIFLGGTVRNWSTYSGCIHLSPHSMLLFLGVSFCQGSIEKKWFPWGFMVCAMVFEIGGGVSLSLCMWGLWDTYERRTWGYVGVLSSPSPLSLQGWVLLLLYPLISSAAFRIFPPHLFSGLWFPSEQLAFCPTTTSSLSFTIFHSFLFFLSLLLLGWRAGFYAIS